MCGRIERLHFFPIYGWLLKLHNKLVVYKWFSTKIKDFLSSFKFIIMFLFDEQHCTQIDNNLRLTFVYLVRYFI